jgi:hypothetical protein
MSEPYLSDVFISSRVANFSGKAAGIMDGDLVELWRTWSWAVTITSFGKSSEAAGAPLLASPFEAAEVGEV